MCADSSIDTPQKKYYFKSFWGLGVDHHSIQLLWGSQEVSWFSRNAVHVIHRQNNRTKYRHPTLDTRISVLPSSVRPSVKTNKKYFSKFSDFLEKLNFLDFSRFFLRIGLDCRALVESCIPHIEKQTGFFFFILLRKYVFKNSRIKKRDILPC